MDYQRQPLNDFPFTVTSRDEGYGVNLNIPPDFDRQHLGGLNILKLVFESIVFINKQEGLENRTGFVKKLLRETRIKMKEEITNFKDVIIEVRKIKDSLIDGNTYQKWTFSLGKNAGSVVAYYVYSRSLD